MRTYELLYIIPATLTDEEVAQTELDVQALIQKYGGTPKESRRLGKFRFAYLIKHVRHGHYVLVNFDAEPDAVAKINEALRIFDRTLRHMIVTAEEAGGEEFSLVQFQEIVVEDTSRDDRGKRRRAAQPAATVSDDVKAAAELEKQGQDDAEEEGGKEAEASPEKAEVAETVPEKELPDLSADELDKKINAALAEEAS